MAAAPTVCIRADSSEKLGAGHVMRALVLAEDLRRHGSNVEFICRTAPGDLTAKLESLGFTVHRLMEGAASEASDAGEVALLLDRFHIHCDWLVVDHYGLSAEWESSLRSRVGQIMVIDDLASRTHDCDVLLDQNFNLDPAARYKGLLPDGCTTLFGPRFSLIRREFAQERDQMRSRDGSIRHVLVSFGGADNGHETFKAVDAVRNIDNSIQISAVVSQSYSGFDELTQLCSETGNAKIYRQPDNLASLMNEADIAIGAGGITTWERCCVGLPALVIAIAPNQEPSMQAMATAQILVYLGPAGQVGSSAIHDSLRMLLDNPAEVRRLSVASAELVDGTGGELVASALLHPSNSNEPQK
jgi:UDP-2,4-diacetamido-2,4,6-trideoxy-beta-L-altropyranose hydrolase